MNKYIPLTIICLYLILLSSSPALSKDKSSEPPLIPLETLYGNPEITVPQISPDGKYITYLAPYEGTMNIWIRTRGIKDDHPLTKYSDRPLIYYFWLYDSNSIIFHRDNNGDERYRVYMVKTDGEITCLTPEEPEKDFKFRSSIAALSPKHPDEILLTMTTRDEWLFDYYLYNIKTGEKKLVKQTDRPYDMWMIDTDLIPKCYTRFNPDNSETLFIQKQSESEPTEVYTWTSEDLIGQLILGFTSDNKNIIMIDSKNRDTSAFTQLNLDDGSVRILAGDPKYDVTYDYFLQDPLTNEILAAGINRDKVEWQIVNDSVKKDFELLEKAHYGVIKIESVSLDNRIWIVGYETDNGPTSYYAYNRDSGSLEFLFHNRPELANLPLVAMKPVSFKARDGLEIPCYLSQPKDGEGWDSPGPMVLYVHGGPQVRENWGFNPNVQWLTNRGYAVLIVNYRGSGGYGKEFRNWAIDGYGRKMQDDLTDAAKWAISERIADPEKIVIFGRSYGGYCVLAALTFTPDLFAAGIEMVGISNLISFLESTNPASRLFLEEQIGHLPCYTDGDRAGKIKDPPDCTQEELAEIEFLKSLSPFYHLENIKAPLLIAAGANDSRVPIAETNQIVDGLKKLGRNVECVVYEDEGHFFDKPENRLDFFHRADKFLARILGGRYEE